MDVTARILQHMDFTADGRYRYRTLQLMDFITAHEFLTARILQHMDFTADGRYRYRTLQHIDFTADERDRDRTSRLQILKILVSFAMYQNR